MTAVGITEPARKSARSGDLTVALALVLTGLFVFFWRQPPGIGEAMRLSLPDGDDVMRLLGVRELLAGQSWFDTTLYRYLPPVGVEMHWSRLIDLPIGGGIVVLTPLIGADVAERVVVAGWPLLLFLVYAGVLMWGGARLFAARAGGLAVLFAAQMIIFRDLFAPGRIDHHNVQITLVTVAAVAFGLARKDARAAIAGGFASAFSLAIGLETLPVVTAIGFAFALCWIAEGARSARSLSLFGVSLAVTAPLAFAAQTAPSLWFAPACDALSMPWLLLASGGGLASIGLVAATPRLPSWQARLAAGALAAGVLLIAFAISFPACLEGPYQIVPEPYRALWLSDILEAFSFHRFFEVNSSAAIQALAPMLIGAIVATLGAWGSRNEDRATLALLAGLLWLGIALAQFQVRTLYITSALYPLVAGWFVDRVLSTSDERRPLGARLVSVLAAILMFGMTWAAGLALAESLRPEGVREKTSRVACHDPQNVAVLASLPPGLVLGQVDMGPNVLLHTPHSIAVAGYHRAPAGIVAGIEAFTGDEEDMRRQVEKLHADYVVVCPNWLKDDAGKPFARELAEGRSVDWLQPLSLPSGPLLAWRVVRDR